MVRYLFIFLSVYVYIQYGCLYVISADSDKYMNKRNKAHVALDILLNMTFLQ